MSRLDWDALSSLPLWGQALAAARAGGRLAAASEALDADLRVAAKRVMGLAESGTWTEDDSTLQARLRELAERGDGLAACLYYAADACHAAYDSGDFSAAESACERSARSGLETAVRHGLPSPLSLHVIIAADIDQIAFACQEFSLGRYDRISRDVLSRLLPVWPAD